ncbi:hypothetical protein V7D15_07195 [Thermoanaerobacter thermohydrosulfuricus]
MKSNGILSNSRKIYITKSISIENTRNIAKKETYKNNWSWIIPILLKILKLILREKEKNNIPIKKRKIVASTTKLKIKILCLLLLPTQTISHFY